MQLFYNETVEALSSQVIFDKEESKHIVKVLRKSVGDVVWVTNGKGVLLQAEIQDDNEKKCVALVVKSTLQQTKNYRLHLVVAPTKLNERYEWFLEKATEIGVDEITPLICDFSERKIIKKERYEKVILSAMKQSLQCYLPILNEVISFSEFVKKPINGCKLVAHCYQNEKKELSEILFAENQKEITILIGPEGDFSTLEIQQLLEKNFCPISLGNNRLRTETAAVVACNSVSIVHQLLKNTSEK